jgi:hypothetical protein
MRQHTRETSAAPWLALAALGALTVFLAGCGPQYSVDRLDVSLSRDAATGRGGSGGSSQPASPAKRTNGAPCGAGSECSSSNCVDGVCCENGCGGVCSRCNLPGNEGRCQPVAKDQDPDNECEPQEEASCGRTGSCDGTGACQRHPAGTMCGAPGCEIATEHAASTCDGLGMCKPGATKSCAPAVCIDQSCGAPCVLPADCQTGFYCDEGTCRIKREMAAMCTMDAQCMSGFCADGVCCGSACKDKCSACNTEGAVGTCTPHADGRDPDNECPVENTITCGNAGGCDGKGGCRFHSAGTFCAHATCTGSTLVAPSACDGKGMCKPGPKTDCGNYVCNGMVCWTACANNDQCKAGKACKISACQ